MVIVAYMAEFQALVILLIILRALHFMYRCSNLQLLIKESAIVLKQLFIFCTTGCSQDIKEL